MGAAIKGVVLARRGGELSGDNHRLIYVPAAFAHGFPTLSPEAGVCYKATDEYSREHAGGVRRDDATIGVAWPKGDRLLRDKDAVLPALEGAEFDFPYTGAAGR